MKYDVDVISNMLTKKDFQYKVIKMLVEMIEMRDKCTAGHSEAVTLYCIGFADYLGLSEHDKSVLKYSAILHDIGKVGIEDKILNKPGKLNDKEFSIMKSHSEKGFKIVQECNLFNEECNLIRHHHERIDGNGYPDRLKGEQLSTLTKILTICDSFDAMTSKRPYHNGLLCTDAIKELERNSGKQFDADLVQKFKGFILSSGVEDSIAIRNFSNVVTVNQ